MKRRTLVFTLAAVIATTLCNVAFAREKVQYLPPATYRSLSSEIDAGRIEQTVRALANFSSRVSGYEGERQAAAFVREHIKSLGLDDFTEYEHEVTVPLVKRAELVLPGGRSLTVHPLWPNLVRTSQLPPTGITANLVYGRNGRLDHFNGQDLGINLSDEPRLSRGPIVLLDFNCGSNWFNAVVLGARAVIFIEPESTVRGEAEAKFLTTPIDIPRFWIDRRSAQQLLSELKGGEMEAHLNCDMRWEQRKVKNFSGMIAGTGLVPDRKDLGKPVRDEEVKKEVIVLHAYYDSMSIAPTLAPGAEQACGLAVMLEVARVLQQRRPARNVMVLATSGHCQALSDARAFFHRRTDPTLPQNAQERNREWLERVTAWFDFEITSGNRAVGTFYKGQFIDQEESVLPSRFADIGNLARDSAKQALAAQGLLPSEVTRARVAGLTTSVERHRLNAAFDEFAAGVRGDQLVDLRRRFDTGIQKLQDDRAKDEKEQKPWDKAKWAEQVSSALNAVREAQFDKFYADCINPIRGKTWRTYLPGGRFAFSSEIATLAGRAGFAFVTVDDGRQRVDTPFDTADRVDFGSVVTQARLIAGVLSEIMRARTVTFPRQLDDNYARVTGKLVTFDVNKSYMPDVPVPGSLAIARLAAGSNKTFTGVRGEYITLVDDQGAFTFAGVPTVKARRVDWRFEGFRPNATTGAIEYAPDLGHWIRDFPVQMQINLNDKELRVVLFECVAMSLFDLVDQRMFRLLSEMYVFDAASDSEPMYWGRSLPLQQSGVSFYEPAAVVYGKRDAKLKVTMGAGIFGLRFTLLNTDRARYMALRARGLRPGVYEQQINLGRGYPVAEWPRLPMTAHRAAWDMWILDDERIRFFAEHAIRNEQVNHLHQLAKAHLDDADHQLAARRYDKYVTAVRTAWSYESKAYPDVQGTASDVVRGVLFYLFLLLPFTYAAERLFVASRDIQKRIIASAVIFIGFFVGLRYAHPAFDILTVPAIVVLLAFIMLALTVAVVSIIVQKFEAQMRQLQIEKGAADSADVGRLGASGAAFSLGIANMRRRKARTALTCVTLILLTFTVLSFTSVQSGDRINKIELGPSVFNPDVFSIVVSPMMLVVIRIALTLLAFVALVVSSASLKKEAQARKFADENEETVTDASWKRTARRHVRYGAPCLLVMAALWSFTSALRTTKPAPPPSSTYQPPFNGIEVRDRNWEPLGEPMARIIDAEYRGRFPVAPRAWYYSTLVGQKSFVTLQYADRLYQASAVVGMRSDEKNVSGIDRALTPGSRWFAEDELFACVVPTEVAKALGIKQADLGKTTITVFGAPLKVIGLIDADQLRPGVNRELAPLRDLDTEPLTPVDYNLMQERRQLSDQPPNAGELEEYLHLPPREVVFTPYDFVIAHGGSLRSVTVNCGDVKTTARELDTMMQRVELNLFVGLGDRTYLVSALSSTSMGNVHNILIPIMIAALIVFNTMLGAVYERMREIGIFGALGLAPVHIASLFLAEAFVYSVLGAIAGYLIGQFSAKLLYETGFFAGLNLNYSSMSAVGTTLIVMAVVMLSTLYPARLASEASVPGVERRWKLPAPVDNVLRLALPFTVSSGQTLGLNVFLKDYMEAHADYSLGHFSVDSVALAPCEANGKEGGWRLEALVWIAPYDLGVSERVRLETVPTDDEFVNEVHITITRESGDEASWMRVTRNFLNTIRKQFLVWRTFKPEVKEQYEEKGRGLLTQLAEPHV